MKNLKAGSLFIFITVALDSIGLGIVIPVLPNVIRRLVADPAELSAYFGYFISSYALMQFLASPLLGALSDRFGRRPVLLASLLGVGLDYIMMAFAPNLIFLFIGRVISGLTGANFTVANAYMADVSNDQNRSSNFGLIGAAFGIGFILGPAIGGLLGSFSPYTPFLVAAAFNILNFLFGWLVLPESLPLENRRKMDLAKLNPLKSFHFLFTASPVLVFIIVYFLFSLGGQTHPSIWTLYTEHQFGWTSKEVGISLTIVGVLSAITQAGLTRIIIPKVGERKAVLWGALGQGVFFTLFGLATEGWMMYAILTVSSVFWVAQPALQSLISHAVPANEQGEMQGTLVSMMSLASILNPIITTQLFAHYSDKSSSHYFPGAPYMFAGAALLLSWILMLIVKTRNWPLILHF